MTQDSTLPQRGNSDHRPPEPPARLRLPGHLCLAIVIIATVLLSPAVTQDSGRTKVDVLITFHEMLRGANSVSRGHAGPVPWRNLVVVLERLGLSAYSPARSPMCPRSPCLRCSTCRGTGFPASSRKARSGPCAASGSSLSPTTSSPGQYPDPSPRRGCWSCRSQTTASRARCRTSLSQSSGRRQQQSVRPHPDRTQPVQRYHVCRYSLRNA
jgi:hypothetical protein